MIGSSTIRAEVGAYCFGRLTNHGLCVENCGFSGRVKEVYQSSAGDEIACVPKSTPAGSHSFRREEHRFARPCLELPRLPCARKPGR